MEVGVQWPSPLLSHSALSLHDPNGSPDYSEVLVMWGADYEKVHASAWIFNVQKKCWKQVSSI